MGIWDNVSSMLGKGPMPGVSRTLRIWFVGENSARGAILRPNWGEPA
ncbi:MAG: hypothetical protein ACLTQI_00460 [Slackia sp.]